MKTNKERLQLVMSEYGLFEKDEISEDSRLEADLALDSLDLVELMMEVEREFDIIIPDEETEQWQTIQDVLDSITKHAN